VALGLFDLRKLTDSKWVFRGSEVENNAQAGALGFRRAIAIDPVYMHTPSPVVRRTGPGARFLPLLEIVKGAGTFPYEALSSSEVQLLTSRAPTSLASANQWLRTKNPRVKRPFFYSRSQVGF